MKPDILELRHVSFSFPRQTHPFFADINIGFAPGQLHFIRGQNGAGKSTFFNILRGAVEPQERVVGQISLAGELVDFAGDESRRQILGENVKLVQQNFDLMLADKLTFEENLQVAKLKRYPGLSLLPEAEKLPAFVQRFGIPHNKAVYLLSGGQRQMLAILMALQKPTKVLLLDEPTAALDAHNANMIMSFLNSLVSERGLTVLIISHDPELVQRYANKQYYQISIDEKSGTRSIHCVVE